MTFISKSSKLSSFWNPYFQERDVYHVDSKGANVKVVVVPLLYVNK